MTYYTSMEEHPIDILNLPSLEERVKANMERGAFGYIRGGSEVDGRCAKIRGPLMTCRSSLGSSRD